MAARSAPVGAVTLRDARRAKGAPSSFRVTVQGDGVCDAVALIRPTRPPHKAFTAAIVEPLILPVPGVGCAIDELQGSAVRIAEIRARTIDDPTLAIFLEEDLDAIGP